jgi:hypothetical protein
MIKSKNLTNGFWVEAINIVVYLKNRSPTKSLDRKNPFESLYGYKLVVIRVSIWMQIIFSCS